MLKFSVVLGKTIGTTIFYIVQDHNLGDIDIQGKINFMGRFLKQKRDKIFRRYPSFCNSNLNESGQINHEPLQLVVLHGIHYVLFPNEPLFQAQLEILLT